MCPILSSEESINKCREHDYTIVRGAPITEVLDVNLHVSLHNGFSCRIVIPVGQPVTADSLPLSSKGYTLKSAIESLSAYW